MTLNNNKILGEPSLQGIKRRARVYVLRLGDSAIAPFKPKQS